MRATFAARVAFQIANLVCYGLHVINLWKSVECHRALTVADLPETPGTRMTPPRAWPVEACAAWSYILMVWIVASALAGIVTADKLEPLPFEELQAVPRALGVERFGLDRAEADREAFHQLRA